MGSGTRPTRVHLLALPETTPGSLYGLHELFAATGVAWAALTGEPPTARRMESRIVAREAAPYSASIGVPIAPQAALAEAGDPDIVVVSDLDLSPTKAPVGAWRDEAAWVRAQFERGAIVCSICTGSVFLAEAGLLDGLEATSHWSTTRLFETAYPQVRLRPERVLCPAGPEHRIVTGGGAGAWTDLALYLIARFCGQVEAIRIAKIFVLGDRSEGQLPFASLGAPVTHEDAVIGRCQDWLAEHYAVANPVSASAAYSGLPERTFKRRFKAATGYAPIDYVQALRIEEAKQMLETTQEPVDAIAHAVGYEDPAFFRRLFRRRTGTTPARYRQRFRVIGMADPVEA